MSLPQEYTVQMTGLRGPGLTSEDKATFQELVDQSKAWAQSPDAPDPSDPASKSAKTWAETLQALYTSILSVVTFTNDLAYVAFRTAGGKILLFFNKDDGTVDFLPSAPLIQRIYTKLMAYLPMIGTQKVATLLRLQDAQGRDIILGDSAGAIDFLPSAALAQRTADKMKDIGITFGETAVSIDWTKLALWGDSRTEMLTNRHTAELQSWLGVAMPGTGTSGLGRSSQTAPQIAARMIGPILTVTGDTIPASGAVSVLTYSANIFYYSNSNWSVDYPAFNSQTGTLAGVRGTYATDTSGNQTFTRAAAGSAVSVPPGSMFIPDVALSWRGGVNYLCAGTNGGAAVPYDVIRDERAARQMVQHGGGILMVASAIGRKRGSAADTNQAGIILMDNLRRAAHGVYFLDLLTPPSTAEMTAAGYTPDSTDTADIAAGYWPAGLYSDDTHFTATGDLIHAFRIRSKFNYLKELLSDA